MALKKIAWQGTIFFGILDTLTIDQHMLFFTIFFNGLSLAWYSTLST